MSPNEWSGPQSSGWEEAPSQQQQPPQQSPPQPPQQPYQQPDSAQQWQQQSQAKYGPPPQQGGGLEAMLSPKMLSIGILLGGALLWVGQTILIFAGSLAAFRAGSFFGLLGSLIVFGSAVMAGTMSSSVDKFSKIGYMMLAGFGLFTLALGGVAMAGFW